MPDVSPNPAVKERLDEYRATKKVLEEEREPWDTHVEEVCRYVYPRRDMWNQEDNERWEKKGDELSDSSAGLYADYLANGLIAYNSGPQSPWFKAQLSDSRLNDFPGVKDWLELSDQTMYMFLHRTNFYDSLYEYMVDAIVVGTATQYVEEDLAEGQIVYKTLHPKEDYFVENEKGRVDTHYRELWMRGRDAMKRYPQVEQESSELWNRWKDDPWTKKEFTQVIHPREDRVIYSDLTTDMPWASSEYTEGEDLLLKDGGYLESPIITSRWSKNSGEDRGRSPAMNALRDVKRLNSEKKSQNMAGQLSVQPPLQGPEAMRSRLTIKPWAYNAYKRPDERIFPMDLGSKYPFGRDIIDQQLEIIRDHFFTDLFLMLANAEREMTAREVMERQGERIAALSGPLTRLNHEYFTPVLKRTFRLLLRAGIIPPPPPVLMQLGIPLEFDFIGLLAQAQKRYYQAQSIQSGLSLVAGVSQFRPDVWDNFDLDDLTRKMAENEGFPQSSIRELPERDQIRAARAKAMEEQRKMDQMGQMADMNPKLAKAPEEGSPGESVIAQLQNMGAG